MDKVLSNLCWFKEYTKLAGFLEWWRSNTVSTCPELWWLAECVFAWFSWNQCSFVPKPFTCVYSSADRKRFYWFYDGFSDGRGFCCSFFVPRPFTCVYSSPAEKGFTGFMMDFMMGGVSAAVLKTADAPLERIKLQMPLLSVSNY